MKLITTLRRVAGRADERGMSTSEYAVGTLGACTIGGVLVKIGQTVFVFRLSFSCGVAVEESRHLHAHQ